MSSCRPLPQFKYLYDMYAQNYLLAKEAVHRRLEKKKR